MPVVPVAVGVGERGHGIELTRPSGSSWSCVAELGRELLRRRGLVVGDERLLEHDHVGVVEAAQHLDEVVGAQRPSRRGCSPACVLKLTIVSCGIVPGT